MTPLRSLVCAEARSWLGTPYHHAADIKGVGVDCAMLLVRVAVSSGLVPADLDPRPYPADWHLHRSEERFLGWLEQHGTQRDPRWAEPGDVLVWRFGRAFSHGGWHMGDGHVVHAHKPDRKVVLGHVSDGGLVGRQLRCYTLKGLQ